MRRKLCLQVLGFALASLLALEAHAQKTIHVPADQPTIQAGINVALTGDTVLVAPGTYQENIDFLGKAITVVSDQGPSLTVIDGGLANPVVTFKASEGNTSVLQGFTIQNGKATFNASYIGGGISISGASPTITGNVITKNRGGCSGLGVGIYFGSPIIQNNTISENAGADCGPVRGGAIYNDFGSPQIVNNTIINNHADEGGAIEFFGGNGLIQGNYISGNVSTGQGSVFYSVNGASPNIINNVMVGNTSGDGSVLSFSVSNGSQGPYVLNNTVADNKQTSTFSSSASVVITGFDTQVLLVNNVISTLATQTGINCDTTYGYAPSTFSHNDVFSPQGTAFTSTCGPQVGTNGNISVDPAFFDAAGGNYHITASSPLIDAGDNNAASLPATDQEGYARKVDGNQDGSAIVDIGAYEYQGTTTMTVTPQSLAFADQKVGVASAAQDVTVVNTGSKPLLLALQIGSDFSETTDCAPRSVAPGASCKVHVSFLPTSSGAHSESLILKSNAGSDVTVSLQGKGLAPLAQVTPSQLTFSQQAVSTTSTSQTVTIQNVGDASLVVSSITISGDFSQTNSCGAPVLPGGSCTVAVTFTPTTRGVRGGTLQIFDDATGSPHSVGLTGTGVAADVQFSTGLVQFSSWPVGSVSDPQTVTLTNSGELPLNISSITSTLDYTQTNNCPASVAPSSSCTVTIRFSPSGIGARQGFLTVTANTFPAQHQLSLTGVGTGAAISILSASTQFPDTVVGTSSAAQAVVIRSSGNVALLISQITTSGDFSQTNNCGTQLNPGQTCAIFVTFKPTVAGTRTGSVSIFQNTVSSPTTISVSGSGLSGFPVPTLTSVSPGAIAVNPASAQTITLTGSNFFAQTTVTWNGHVAATTYVSPSQLQVTLASAVFYDTGEIAFAVHNPTPGGGDSGNRQVIVYRTLPVSARAMVFDASRQVLYAAVPGASPTNGNYIVKIDPLTGNVQQLIYAGSEPSHLALSDDAQFLYVGLDGSASVARVNLATNTIDETISLGSPSTVRIGDLATVPGLPHSVAVLESQNASPSFAGIVIYDDATARKNSITGNTGPVVDWILFFGGGGQLLGSQGEISDFSFSRFSVDSNGISFMDATPGLGGGRLSTDSQRVYETNPPRQIDPSSKTVVGRFSFIQNFVSSIFPDANASRVFLLSSGTGPSGSSGTQIYAGDPKTFSQVAVVELPTQFSTFGGQDLLRWGSSGLAFRLYNGATNVGGYSPNDQVILLRSSVTGTSATLPERPPSGWIDSAVGATGLSTVGQNSNLVVSGWSVDPADGIVSRVDIFVDGSVVGSATLGFARPDVANAFQDQRYANSGWSFSYNIGSLAPGTHTITATAHNSAGTSASLSGPRSFTVDQAPQGWVDTANNASGTSSVIGQNANLVVSGWATDVEDGNVSRVDVLIDGNVVGNATLGLSRTDVANALHDPRYANSGWSLSYNIGSLAAGAHTASAVAYDSVGGSATLQGGRSFTVDQAPQGWIDTANNASGTSSVIGQNTNLIVSGWATDVEDGNVSRVDVLIDGNVVGNATLGLSRPDVASTLHDPRYVNSGWSLSYNIGGLAAGAHTASAVAYDSVGGAATLQGARTFTVDHAPQGWIDVAGNASGTSSVIPQNTNLVVSGWAADAEDGTASRVDVVLDGNVIGSATLGLSRPDVANAFHDPRYANSGWTFSYNVGTLSAGKHTVTAVAYDLVGIATTLQGPQTITIDLPPIGWVDSASGLNSSTTISQNSILVASGWAIDPEDTTVARVDVLVDGNLVGSATLGLSRPDVAAALRDARFANSGWSLSYNVASLALGAHTLSAVAYDSQGGATVLNGKPTFNVQ